MATVQTDAIWRRIEGIQFMFGQIVVARLHWVSDEYVGDRSFVSSK